MNDHINWRPLNLLKYIAQQFENDCSYDEPMAVHTSWGIGGPVDLFFSPKNRDELVSFLSQIDSRIPITWIGKGTNMLVRDRGVRGVVISTKSFLQDITKISHQNYTVEAGVSCMDLALFCQKINIGPAAFFSGIPGSIGGALVMNAGAFGHETWNQVIKVEVIDQKGRIQYLDRDQFGVSYLTVNCPFPLWFLSCVISFSNEDKTTMEDLKELRDQRIKKQPLTEDTCGSVFKNPTDHFAGKLIEQAGLKGFKIGSASISKQHANFIINEGGAKAEDIEKLIDHVRTVIKKKYDIDLHTEVRIIGEK